MSDKPKLIIFDLGRVIVDFDFQKVVRDLQKYSSFSEEKILHFFRTTKSWDSFERGTMSADDFFKVLAKDLELKGLDRAGFTPLWNEIFTVKEDTLALIRELRGQYRLAMLSNVNILHWEHIRGTHDFMTWFDPPIASYAVGQRKPEIDIYHTVLHRAGVKPSEAVFTDDVEAHITAARSIGIRGHVFTTAAQLRKDLADLL